VRCALVVARGVSFHASRLVAVVTGISHTSCTEDGHANGGAENC
jgi:hypothetical protein